MVIQAMNAHDPMYRATRSESRPNLSESYVGRIPRVVSIG
jgi:hypothetical protein